MVIGASLFTQTPFEFNLNKYRANRIVLLGEQPSSEMGKWRQALDSEHLYDYGFVLLNRASFLNNRPGIAQRYGIESKDIGAFERWARQLYGVGQARWFALDMD
jgi:hypothetical protein